MWLSEFASFIQKGLTKLATEWIAIACWDICRFVGMFLLFSFTEDLQKWDIPKWPRNHLPCIPRHKIPGAHPTVPLKAQQLLKFQLSVGEPILLIPVPKPTTDFCCSRYVLWAAAFNLAVLPEALCTWHFMTPRE